MIKTEKIRSDWAGGMRVDSQAGEHRLIIDQPTAMGGENAGPNPMAYLLVALGGCLGTVAAIVARQEQIELRKFSIEVEGDYDVDIIMGRADQGRAGFREIRQRVEIEADLTDEEKAAFFEKVHARCPVTDTILSQTPIIYEVA